MHCIVDGKFYFVCTEKKQNEILVSVGGEKREQQAVICAYLKVTLPTAYFLIHCTYAF